MIADGSNLFSLPKPVEVPDVAPPETMPEPKDAGNPELVIRDQILQTHEFSHSQILSELREKMKSLYKQRRAAGWDVPYVTADDARLILDTDKRYENVGNKNFMGQLFRAKGWEKTGQIIQSKTPRSHGNELKCWRWVEPESRIGGEAA